MPSRTPCRLFAAALLACACLTPRAWPQLSINSAVDLAVRSNPRVKSAQDDVAKAQAQLAEAHDAYIPSITAGAGLGQAYGYSQYPPTLFTMSAGSLVYNASQHMYIQSARAGVRAAELALEDAREAVAEDTALAVFSLDHDLQREKILAQQNDLAARLIAIVQARVDAGQDSQLDLTQTRLTAANLHLAGLRAQDETATDRDHLGRLIGLPATGLTVTANLPDPTLPAEAAPSALPDGYATPGIASAFASAEARRLQAAGDNKFRYRPLINFVAQYNRYATFSNSFQDLNALYNNKLTANEAVFGVQITIPLLDKSRTAKAHESAADAAHSLHETQAAQITALDGQSRLRHSLAELQAQSEVAALKQQLAQQQLDIVTLQLKAGSGNPNAPQPSPKEQQNARIDERDKALAVADATFQLRQAQIQLLRQTGGLDDWLRTALRSTTTP